MWMQILLEYINTFEKQKQKKNILFRNLTAWSGGLKAVSGNAITKDKLYLRLWYSHKGIWIVESKESLKPPPFF